jgi:photosystem II stability/assembly factor-like uncharacterized protein
VKKFILVILITATAILFSQTYGWKDLSNNIPTTSDFADVYFISDDEGWVTNCFDPEIYHTTDGGKTFEVQKTQYFTYAIHMINKNEGYAERSGGVVMSFLLLLSRKQEWLKATKKRDKKFFVSFS